MTGRGAASHRLTAYQGAHTPGSHRRLQGARRLRFATTQLRAAVPVDRVGAAAAAESRGGLVSLARGGSAAGTAARGTAETPRARRGARLGRPAAGPRPRNSAHRAAPGRGHLWLRGWYRRVLACRARHSGQHDAQHDARGGRATRQPGGSCLVGLDSPSAPHIGAYLRAHHEPNHTALVLGGTRL